ncbi:MAG: hypothetical protein AB1941_15895 [Gemmatimonadota bacterium]
MTVGVADELAGTPAAVVRSLLRRAEGAAARGDASAHSFLRLALNVSPRPMRAAVVLPGQVIRERMEAEGVGAAERRGRPDGGGVPAGARAGMPPGGLPMVVPELEAWQGPVTPVARGPLAEVPRPERAVDARDVAAEPGAEQGPGEGVRGAAGSWRRLAMAAAAGVLMVAAVAYAPDRVAARIPAWAPLRPDPLQRARAAVADGRIEDALVMAEVAAGERGKGAPAAMVRGAALMARGDTAGAHAAWYGAAAAPPAEGGGGDVAWEAAMALERTGAEAGTVAEAFLEAFAAGIDPGKWERVAAAQERAGRAAQAERVRRGGR